MIEKMVGLLLLLTALPAAAEPLSEIQNPGPTPSPPKVEPIRLTVRPAPEPVPALKYRLLPELEDQSPGNAIFFYYRAFSPEWYGTVRQPGMSEKMEKGLQVPLKEINHSEVGWVQGTHMLREVDRGARCESCDWHMVERLRKDGPGLLIPDMQGIREFGKLLAVRARLEMADGHFDKALYTLQTGFALGRHASEGPTLIQDLIGAAIAHMMMARLEELVQRPGAPNLYWALTNLPRPLVSCRKGFQGERMWLNAAWPRLHDLEEAGPLSPQEQQKLIGGLTCNVLYLFNTPNMVPFNRLDAVAAITQVYPRARQALIARGRKPEIIDALPTIQVVALYVLQDFRQLQDDIFKWQGLPYWQALPGARRTDQERAELKNKLGAVSAVLELLPGSIQGVLLAEARLERRLAALRCVEAFRLYAAAHDGKLPVL